MRLTAQVLLDRLRADIFHGDLDLRHGHLYEQGPYLFVAHKPPGAKRAWILARVDKETRQLGTKFAGDVLAHVRGENGDWHTILAGVSGVPGVPDVNGGKREAVPVFDPIELKHIGASLVDYDLHELLRDVAL